MGLMHTSWLRARTPQAMSGLVLGASLIAGAAGGISAQDASPSAADCNVEQAVADAALVYTVDGEQSLATYTVMEDLASIGSNEVNGTTNAIIGSILFEEDGTPLACSNFAVDMRTMETDESRRDNYLRENTLESDTYPFATFVVASVEGVDGPLVEGEATTLQLTGDLTIHGVTKTVTWEAEVTREADTLTGTATYTFLIEDFGMEKPIVGPVVGIDDEVTLTIDIVANVEDAG
jgi:polyisoprenoid-binding protein YceI